MAITNFVRTEFNRVIHEELIDTKFADFGQGLVTVFLQSIKLVKTHTFPMEIMEDLGRSISSVLETQALKLHFVF